jgi:hypothetical protein
VKRRAFSAYGLQIRSPFELPHFDSPATGSPEPYDHADLTLRLADDREVAERWSDANGAPPWQTMFPQHCHVRLERGQAGDHLLTFGRTASFHLDREGRTLLCSPAEPESVEWQRFLLDTVLYCVSLIRGFEALHASAVSVDDGVVAVVAAPGGGKSTLAAELVSRGHSLFADDVLALDRADGEVLAHAGPPLMTLPAGGCAVEEVGEPLDVPTEEGTSWVHVRDAGGEPQPLSAIFILDRRREGDLQPLRETAHGRLLPHMLSLDRQPARALARFGLLQELVGRTPVYGLFCADRDLAELATIVEQERPVAESDLPSTLHHVRAA